ncbi:hypothetical protein DH2020_046245 [Rehmannia glutinosa]|uniref:DUF7910 domain-containing protein n=1 Tax=Rehmannia glutinosa TaxID=99300 RepID=A0ABR0UBU5_REHGL
MTTESRVEGLPENARVRGVNLGGWLVIEGWIKPSLFDDIPNGDMLVSSLPSYLVLLSHVDGTEVQFKSVTSEKYVSAENGGGSTVAIDRDIPLAWETFRVEAYNQIAHSYSIIYLVVLVVMESFESIFQFRTYGGQFLTCDGDGGTVSAAASDSPSDTETFYVERNNDNRVYIKLKTGTYLQLANGYGHDKAEEILKNHRNSFITVEDFDFLYRHGINTVRIPVGWWIAYDPDPPPPFIREVWKLLTMHSLGHSETFGIKCIIDLHAAPGSQNGMEHSASRDGTTGWPTSSDYISQTLHVIDFLASRIGNADPFELYQANLGTANTVIDLHYYNLFDPFFANMSSVDNIQYIYKSRQTQLQALNGANGPLVFIGEWVNEWNVTGGSQTEYQDFGRAQLEVYNAASSDGLIGR